MIFISARSEKYKQDANNFLGYAVQLRDLIGSNTNNLSIYNNNIIEFIESVRNFKRLLLEQLSNATEPPAVLLPPTFISHMLNELEKFRYITHHVKLTGILPPIYSLNEHKLWLIDIAGHLGAIKDNLDDMEKIMRHRTCEQKKVFEKLHAKSIELIGYLKHEILPNNAIAALTSQAEVETLVYLHLVKEVADMVKNKYMLGIIDTHMLNHMIFEELYYLKNLQSASNFYDPLQCCQIKHNDTSMNVILSMNA